MKEHLITYGCCSNENDVQFICEIISEELIRSAQVTDEEENLSSDEKYENGECALCEREMSLTFHHLIPRETHKKMMKKDELTKQDLSRGIMICRPCHSAIHKFIDEETMAIEYSTLEKLLEHEMVQKWIPYIAKQKSVSKSEAELYHSGKLGYKT